MAYSGDIAQQRSADTTRPRTRLAQAGRQAARVASYVLLYVVLLSPIVVFVLHAFSLRWFYPQVLPATWALEPFVRQLRNPQTLEALGASVQIALLVSGLSLLVGYPAARTLGLYSFPGKGLVYMLLFLPTVVPPIATGIGLNILFLQMDLAGTLFGVALVHLIPVLPYSVFTLASVFARYDPTFEQQALVLGASRPRIFWSITLPMVLPGIMVSLLFAFLISWSQYLLTLLIGGGRVVTLPILLFSTVSGGNPTTISIQALMFVALPALGILAVARYLGVGANTSHLTR
jgi:putative spermidine/putrescine transport system permease protein